MTVTRQRRNRRRRHRRHQRDPLRARRARAASCAWSWRAAPATRRIGATTVVDLNPHLDYQTGTVPQSRATSRWAIPARSVDAATAARLRRGHGLEQRDGGRRAGNARRTRALRSRSAKDRPASCSTSTRARLYVLDKFESARSPSWTAWPSGGARVRLPRREPKRSSSGRKHLYDTRKNSGLGQIACASCHVDARMDRLAWDLGDPSGAMASRAGRTSARASRVEHGLPALPPDEGSDDHADAAGHHRQGAAALARRPRRLEQFNGAFRGCRATTRQLTP
jgi:hypothetical protein